ncbi:MAG: tRNA uridine-5-carboxymethylaminomethyl(34) synthesis GTPase MnmE [Lachnospiraceae bacterium]|nr:tRNA uridine-5-carboxymethylaminomethyl(34) synthesis GTPase MnmE [Lachnospiraceae bacterium]
MKEQDTIAAIATGTSDAGIGIIRISGGQAFEAAAKLFRTPGGRSNPADFAPNSIHFGYIVEKGEIIDEVLLTVMKAPHSYTTEDTVEINTHGGVFVMNRVLQLVLQSGVRLAEPGEFTKRAFLGGRIDLSRAEAVMDLISSQSEFARKTAVAQLEGSVSESVRTLREKILYEIAFIESALDDPENFSLEGYPEKLRGICSDLLKEMKDLIEKSGRSQSLRRGIRTVIAGKPNAGKSSLLNRLVGRDRAIVTEIAGTTRDILEETARIGEVLLCITDTAGIHETDDRIEQIGIERAVRALDEAELILFVADSSEELTTEDQMVVRKIATLAEKRGKADPVQCIAIRNKTDLGEKVTQQDMVRLFEAEGISAEHLSCSMTTGEGLDKLENKISELFRLGEILEKNEVFLANARQTRAMQDAADAIAMTMESIDRGMSEDFFSIDLMNAYQSLGTIIGEAVEDDLVEEIFSNFCLGK